MDSGHRLSRDDLKGETIVSMASLTSREDNELKVRRVEEIREEYAPIATEDHR